MIYTIISIILILVIEDSTWNPHGMHHSRWNPYGIHMEMGWNSCGRFHMDSKWTFHMEWWNPCGIWPFHVEYGWNGITKMGGIPAKTYSIWNGWNPSGMTWIPHGFHVECGGRVKTSIHKLLLGL
jgi:hypothetical protein